MAKDKRINFRRKTLIKCMWLLRQNVEGTFNLKGGLSFYAKIKEERTPLEWVQTIQYFAPKRSDNHSY